MVYRNPNEQHILEKLFAAELELEQLKEENSQLRELLKTETTRSTTEKPEMPELLNASMLYEPNPFVRAFYKYKCLWGNHRWVVMIDLEKAKKTGVEIQKLNSLMTH